MQSFDKNQVIKMAKQVFKRGQGIPDKRLMHPRREWAIGLLIFMVILFTGSAFSANSFARFRNINTTGGDAGVDIPTYQKKRVGDVIEMYSARSTNFKLLVDNIIFVPEIELSSTTDESATSTDALGEEDEVAEEVNTEEEIVVE